MALPLAQTTARLAKSAIRRLWRRPHPVAEMEGPDGDAECRVRAFQLEDWDRYHEQLRSAPAFSRVAIDGADGNGLSVDVSEDES